MGEFIADATIKQLIIAGKAPKNSKVVIFGLTFKENCPDIRNSKVEDIIKRLKEYEINSYIVDPWANEDDAKKEYGVTLTKMEYLNDVDCIILAVAHDEFKYMSLDTLNKLYKDIANHVKILIDVKSIYNKLLVNEYGFRYWRL